MKASGKVLIVAALAAAVIAAIAFKNNQRAAGSAESTATAIAPPAPADPAAAAPAVGRKLPKLLDLGAGRCIPCKMMAPVLEQLKTEYAGKLDVEFIDVWVNPDAARPYGIEVIPTQIFYGADGRELFRHVGYFAREDIVAKWKELGVDLAKP